MLNKHAMLRYTIIDRCLINKQHPYPSKHDLQAAMQEIGAVSISTVERDIRAMRFDEVLGFHAPIAYSKGNNGYYYTDPEYSIHQIAYNLGHLQAVEVAMQILDRYLHLPLLEPFKEITRKIKKNIGVQIHPGGPHHIMPHIPEPAAGMENLGRFYHAIENQDVLHFTYTLYGSSRTFSPVFHPYALKEYDRRWYAVGYAEYANAIRIFGLDRVSDISECFQTDYFRSPDFNINTFFRHTIGITANPESPVLDIMLRFTAKQAKYLVSAPLHHSQQVVEESSKYSLISFRLIESYELISKILSYGKTCEVLSPEPLAKRVWEAKFNPEEHKRFWNEALYGPLPMVK